MFKTKLISQEGNFDKKLFFYGNGSSLYQFHWFPFVRAYKIRPLHKQEPLKEYYTHEEIVIATRPNAKGQISFKLAEP